MYTLSRIVVPRPLSETLVLTNDPAAAVTETSTKPQSSSEALVQQQLAQHTSTVTWTREDEDATGVTRGRARARSGIAHR
jgi:hypothetical protein